MGDAVEKLTETGLFAGRRTFCCQYGPAHDHSLRYGRAKLRPHTVRVRAELLDRYAAAADGAVDRAVRPCIR